MIGWLLEWMIGWYPNPYLLYRDVWCQGDVVCTGTGISIDKHSCHSSVANHSKPLFTRHKGGELIKEKGLK